MPYFLVSVLLLSLASLVASCTQEQQNRISRGIQNWTGANGVLDVIAGDKVLYRFIKVDKLSTATSTSSGNISRPYRFGYGVFDLNQNYTKDEGEKKVYFEVSDYSTFYVFYENPYRTKPASDVHQPSSSE